MLRLPPSPLMQNLPYLLKQHDIHKLRMTHVSSALNQTVSATHRLLQSFQLYNLLRPSLPLFLLSNYLPCNQAFNVWLADGHNLQCKKRKHLALCKTRTCQSQWVMHAKLEGNLEKQRKLGRARWSSLYSQNNQISKWTPSWTTGF